jgi:uncharacterized protein (DUF3084 family)
MVRAKVFEKIAQNSLMQQNSLHVAMREERDGLVKSSEEKIEELERELKEKGEIENINAEAVTNSTELKTLKQNLSAAKSQISSYRSQMYGLKSEVANLKSYNRETGRILYDLNEFARED